MNIAVVSNTTIPATLPDDPDFFTTYGSEVYNSLLVKGLADKGHKIRWYAPIKSSMFIGHDNIDYWPTTIAKDGENLPDERLEKISFRPAKTTDLLDFDFVIDMSKQNHITEELSSYYEFSSYCQYKSGYKDWTSPRFGPAHFVTHCQTFADNFVKNGQPRPEVARFGIPDFWCIEHYSLNQDPEVGEKWWYSLGLEADDYYLFPHRPSFQKGFDKLQQLAVKLPYKQFVIATAAVFKDHKAEMAELKKSNLASNLKIIDVPEDKNYHRYRRALMRNATAVLSPFTTKGDYMDTGGLVSFEAIRCGTPVIVTRSPSSEEMLGSLEGKGVTFVGDDIDSLSLSLRTNIERPQVDNSWMPVSSFVEDYLQIMETYKSRR